MRDAPLTEGFGHFCGGSSTVVMPLLGGNLSSVPRDEHQRGRGSSDPLPRCGSQCCSFGTGEILGPDVFSVDSQRRRGGHAARSPSPDALQRPYRGNPRVLGRAFIRIHGLQHPAEMAAGTAGPARAGTRGCGRACGAWRVCPDRPWCALAMPDAHHPWCAGSADLGQDAARAPEGREATLAIHQHRVMHRWQAWQFFHGRGSRSFATERGRLNTSLGGLQSPGVASGGPRDGRYSASRAGIGLSL